MKHRILLSTSRALRPPGAWGQAAVQLHSEGHKIVAALGFEPAEHWPDKDKPRLLPSNIRTLMPEQVSVSTGAIREYSVYRRSAGYAETHGMLLLMMSRVDSTGTFRSLEREVLARKIHLEIFTALTETKPTMAIFDVTPHEAMDFALLRVLEWQRVPVLMFQPSLVGPQVMARSSLTETLPLRLDQAAVSRHSTALEEVYRIADASIQRLADGTGTPRMDNQKAKEAYVGTLRSRLSALRFSLQRLRVPGRDVAFALTGHIGIPVRLRRAAELFLERSLRLSLRKTVQNLPSLDEAPPGRFVLFALHYEPERSSIPEGYPFDSQLDAIAAARSLLPEDVTLYVKEHFSQQAAALRGFVGRSPDFYELLESLPGVEILGTKTDTRKLMRSAECVMTFTGKVGIEAALEGSRVLYLGQPWWDQMPGAHNFSTLRSYQDLLSAPIPSPTEVQSWLEGQIRSALLPGVSSVPPERHSKRIAQLPPGFEAVEAEGIIAAVHAVMAKAEKDSQDT